MTHVWKQRLKGTAAGLFAAALAAAGVSGILSAAGDAAGGSALLGASAMFGVGFVIDVAAVAFWPAERNSNPQDAV